MTEKQLKRKASDLGYQSVFLIPTKDRKSITFKGMIEDWNNQGLTKREYFAGLAMQGVVQQVGDISIKSISKVALQQANALLEELAKEEE